MRKGRRKKKGEKEEVLLRGKKKREKEEERFPAFSLVIFKNIPQQKKDFVFSKNGQS